MDLQLTILIVAALLTSLVSGLIGMAGGIILLAVMDMFIPLSALVPVHGAVQLISNGTRVSLHIKHVKWSIGLPLVLGAGVGALIASTFTMQLQSQEEFRILLAGFILLMTWKPKLKKGFQWAGKFYLVGLVSGIVSMLFGATGPFLAPFFLNENLDRFQIISTKAFSQMAGHFFKVIAFTILGFAYSEYAFTILLMAVAVVLGTYISKKILRKFDDKTFLILFKGVITLLCIRMIILYFQ
ncbi:MAG: sulfite exporter TauE/SafE family protein [Bdellovibrionales bacterium]